MSTQNKHFDLLLDQRYFHFVVLQGISSYSLADYWRQLGKTVAVGRTKDEVPDTAFDIQHRRLLSNLAYPRGKLLEIVSESHDGSPPYLYDLFALRIDSGKHTYYVFAFPFVALAREVVDNLIAAHDLRKRCDILKVNLPMLVQQIGESAEPDQVRTHIAGLQVGIPGDPLLTSVSLGGDNPLGSSLYRDYLQEPIRKGQSTLERCILACEISWSRENTGAMSGVQPHQRARIHMDQFGNFKFYAHLGGENLVVIPNVLRRLVSSNCVQRASSNPLHRAEDEGE